MRHLALQPRCSLEHIWLRRCARLASGSTVTPRVAAWSTYGCRRCARLASGSTASASLSRRRMRRPRAPRRPPGVGSVALTLTLTARGRKRCPRPAVLAQRADAYCAAAATVWRLRLLCLLRLLGAYSAYWAAAYLRGGYYCAAAAGLASGPRHPVVPPGCSSSWAAIAHLVRVRVRVG